MTDMTAAEQAELDAYIAELDAQTNFEQEDPDDRLR